MPHNTITKTALRTFAFTTATIASLAAPGLGLAGGASAASIVPGDAQDTISSLQDQGYNVQVNGTADEPMSQCTVTGVHGMSNSNVDAAGNLIDPTKFTTAYVDISCPND